MIKPQPKDTKTIINPYARKNLISSSSSPCDLIFLECNRSSLSEIRKNIQSAQFKPDDDDQPKFLYDQSITFPQSSSEKEIQNRKLWATDEKDIHILGSKNERGKKGRA